MDPNFDHHEYCTGGFDPEDIVITGIAGRFPECNNVGELKECLFNKKDLVMFSDARFEKGEMSAPYDSCGLVQNLDKLDAVFFGCSSSVANYLDPCSRIHMEVAYEAIADAGVDPTDLKGEKIGVFNATTHDDAIKINTADETFMNLSAIRTMNANRTTYALGFTGPSYSVDSACSSSSVALWSAVNSIKSGIVEAAIVSGCQLNLHPAMLVGYMGSGIASLTGNSRPFDAGSDGMIKTEAIVALFLQKAKVARRVYATIPAVKFYSAGFVPDGISVPSEIMLNRIIVDTFKDAKVDLDEVEYIEAHGTGTLVGDTKEVAALTETFCKNRKKPLLIGTIKSNIGHTEASSGVCGVVKAIITFENDAIPPNIKYENPNPRCQSLLDGKIAVVTEPTPFNADYMPVSSLGFGGTLVETLLKKNPVTYKGKEKILGLPRLVLFPATTEEAITSLFDYVQNTPNLHEEFFALLHKLSFTDPFLKQFRGYAVYQQGSSPVSEIKNVTSKRQVWFIMTGMGCQWPGMGLQLMEIDVFAKSMKKSAETLKPYGIDLFEILRADKDYFQRERSITVSFVGICAIQIAVVDLLKHLGVNPDGMVGHSVGELLCSYADGCTTAEQTLTSAYLRGQAVESANLAQGGMAAVGVSWSQAKKMCPEGIYPACDNADDSVTISGLKEPIEKFVKKLQQDNVFVRLVNAQGYGFHCQHVHAAAPSLRAAMAKVITKPKPRSERWISTSYRESEWNNPDCRMASAEYFVHNLMSSVLFNDAVKKIPSDAVVIEIGPHPLLQSILKRAIGPRASFFGLMKRNNEDNVKYLLDTLGKLYIEGVNPKIELLYPPVKFPVPRGTPMISDLIRWNHSQSFHVPKYTPKTSEFSREFKFGKEDAYILDHKIDGRSLFPATGYIYLAWEALASKVQKNHQELPVVIENFKIYRAVIITASNVTKFYVNILDSSGRFEITEGKSVVASGLVYECKNLVFQESSPEYASSDLSVSGKDIYNDLKRAGYEYGPSFQGVVESNIEGNAGLVQWNDQWIPFLDALLLFFGILTDNEEFCLPTGALYFKIDPNILKNTVSNAKPRRLPVRYNKNTKRCRSVGVEIAKLIEDSAPRRGRNDNPTLEQYTFIPYVSKYAPTGDSRRQLSKHFLECNETINKLGKALGKDVKQYQFLVDNKEDFEFEEFDDEVTKNQHLIRVLKLVTAESKLLKDKGKDWFNSYTRVCGQDISNNILMNEESLRIMLEVISENTFRKLSVVEVNRNFPVVLIPATNIMQKYFHIKFKKSILVAPMSFDVNHDVLKEYSIQMLPEDSLKDTAKEKVQDIAISSFTYGPLADLKNLLRTLTSLVKSSGFIMLFYKEKANPAELFLSSVCGEELQVHSAAVLERHLQDESLVVLSKISDPFGGFLYLLRSPCLVSPQRILQIKDDSYDWVENVKKELYEKKSGIVWLVSEGCPVNGLIGMVNCLKQEPEGERIRSVFISRSKDDDKVPPFSLENPFYTNLVTKNLIMNVWKNGSWGSFRHLLIKEIKVPRSIDHSYVNCRKYGDLSSFEWIESNVKYVERKNQKLVHIYYSALNFRDVMLATGKLSIRTTKHLGQGNSVLGLEFSGREDSTGKRVLGFASARAMASAILAEPAYCIDVPDNWTLEEAATIPVVYATCYYALIIRAKLQKGESILIHSGTGGIGIAAISIAIGMNCEVFTTVGNDQKKKYLKRRFPQLKDENIGCSRNTSFEHMIMEKTNGRGVDVLLNSLADDKFQASLRCIAKSGRFIEIGKYDLALDREIGLKMFLENISFIAVFLDQMFDSNPKTLQTITEIMDLIKEGIRTGIVQPLDRTVFDRNSVEESFRYMAKGVHIGKILLKIRDEEPGKCAIPKCLTLPALPETQFYNNKVYIVIGGLGGFGIEVTKWIIQKGGRNIILTSRYGARTPYHYFSLKRWENNGAKVRVSTLNVSIKSAAEKLLQEASKIGPVGGIFNSAVVLKDAFLDCQTTEKYKEVCAPKAAATKNLDELSRKFCPCLDYFVCFSSISCGRGNAGQTNYGYANSVMERVCEERRNAGLHGLAIQWGIIGEVGVVHRHMGDDAMIAGVMAQGVKSCLDTLDAFCQQECPVVTSYVTAEVTKKSVQGDALARIMKTLGLEDSPNSFRKLGEMGIDSLLGVEVKQMIESYTNVTVTMQEVQDMRMEDIKTLFEKADSEKSESQTPALLATTTIKLPPTLLHKDPLVVFNKNAPGDAIFIVDIGDTDITNFQIIAEALNRSVYALVWTKDVPTTDIESLASFYLKLIQNTVQSPFHVIGHSLGGNVAFEIAHQSEKMQTKLKTITLLGGSDDLMNEVSAENIENKDPEVTALCKFVEQFVSGGAPRMEDELMKMGNLEERTRTVLNYLINFSGETVNKAEVSEAINGYLQKHRVVQPYSPRSKLSMDLNIIESPTKLLANDVALVKELLSQVCTGKISIHRVLYSTQSPTEEDVQRLIKVLQDII